LTNTKIQEAINSYVDAHKERYEKFEKHGVYGHEYLDSKRSEKKVIDNLLTTIQKEYKLGFYKEEKKID